ncbi:MAG TPA: sulfite exporter TauE/SafE family protein [Kofleriaceae bacterium]|nr:sulfite exporter TauE/SafE family protein [Kofleriaceae bacterium]
MRRKASLSTWVFALGVAVWVVSGVIWWLSAAPLGHDEAQYAMAFQHLLSGEPPRWVYLSKGMHAVAGPGVLLGGGELALRVAPLLCGLGFLLAAAHLAWRVFGATTAAWTVVVLASAKPVVRRSVELLSDFPSTAALLAGTTVVVMEVVQPSRPTGPSWRLLWAAPLFAAAFYLRYGSCVPIAIVGVAALVAGWRAVRRPVPVAAAAVLLALLLLPHFWDSLATLGSPLAVLLESQRVPQAEVSGLRTYLTSDPVAFYGRAVAPLLVLGALLPGWLALRRWRRFARAPGSGPAPSEELLRARRALGLGLLNAVLPCGWLWAFVALAAGTGSALLGASTMLAFWLGTMPALLGATALATPLLARVRSRWPLVTAALVMSLAGAALLLRWPLLTPTEGQAPTCHDPGAVPAATAKVLP